MVKNSVEQCDDTKELETYNQCMKWLEEAKNGFSSWYDRQTKNRLVIIAIAYTSWLSLHTCTTFSELQEYRSLLSISRMPIKCAYLPEKSLHKSYCCISHTGEQMCIGLNNGVLPSCWVWVNTMSASVVCRRRVPGELSMWFQQLVMQLTSHRWQTGCQSMAATRRASRRRW